MFEERWGADVEKALAKADKVAAKHEVDTESAEDVKTTASGGE